jgi:hypothetical protein
MNWPEAAVLMTLIIVPSVALCWFYCTVVRAGSTPRKFPPKDPPNPERPSNKEVEGMVDAYNEKYKP